MTLIIGCVTKEYGIVAGDTQLSFGDLPRGNFDRLVKVKVHQYGSDLMMGILGNWGYISPMKDGTGTHKDYFKTLNREIQKPVVNDKHAYLKIFLPGKPIIKATAICIKREKSFVLDCVTSDGDSTTIKTIDINGRKLMFNEPFYSTSPDFIENRIQEFCAEHKLTDDIQDSIFLLNNIILEVIAKGKALDLSTKGVTSMDIPNTVGGYVTMQVMTDDIHRMNCLYSVYKDSKVLLDGTTYPFARTVDHSGIINYVDNLAMLAKNSVNSHNGITGELKEVLVNQMEFLHSKEILSNDLINNLIDVMNDKYKLKLVKIKEDKADESMVLFLGGDEAEENHEFYRRFI